MQRENQKLNGETAFGKRSEGDAKEKGPPERSLKMSFVNNF